jgi:hypothetical protein
MYVIESLYYNLENITIVLTHNINFTKPNGIKMKALTVE